MMADLLDGEDPDTEARELDYRVYEAISDRQKVGDRPPTLKSLVNTKPTSRSIQVVKTVMPQTEQHPEDRTSFHLRLNTHRN